MSLVDCQWGAWTPWSPCSKVCGTGLKSRSRQIAIEASGGRTCTGSTQESIQCVNRACSKLLYYNNCQLYLLEHI